MRRALPPHLEQCQVVVQHARGRLLDAHHVRRIGLAGATVCSRGQGLLSTTLSMQPCVCINNGFCE